MMRSFLVRTLLALVAGTMCAENYPDIAIQSSTDEEIVFTFTPHYLAPVKIFTDRGEATRYPFEGESGPVMENIHKPDLRSYRVPIAVPEAQGTTFEIISSQSEELHEASYAPVPGFKRDAEGIGFTQVYTIDKEFYSRGEIIPSSVASLEESHRIRSVDVAAVVFTPVQWESRTGIVRRAKSVTVRVRFGAKARQASIPLPEKEFEFVSHIILNANRARTWQYDVAARALGAYVPAPMSEGTWLRIDVSSEGLYKVDRTTLQNNGIDPDAVDPQTIKLYGNGGFELSEVVEDRKLNELAIDVQKDGNGKFQYLVFYGNGLGGWRYSAGAWRHEVHHYAKDKNSYMLAIGTPGAGKRIPHESSVNIPTPASSTAFSMRWIEMEKAIGLGGTGRTWYDDPIVPGQSITRTIDLPGIDRSSTQAVTYKSRAIARSSTASSLAISERGQQVATVSFSPIFPDAPEPSNYQSHAYSTAQRAASSISGETSSLSLSYSSLGADGRGSLDWIEIFYPRSLAPRSGTLDFLSKKDTSERFSLSGFSGDAPRIYDISRFDSVVQISPLTQGSGRAEIGITTGSRERRFFACNEGAIAIPTVIKISNGSIRSANAPGADLLIITNSLFLPAAEKLAAHRNSRAQITASVATIDDLYKEFSYGVADITAFRDYIKFAFDQFQTKVRYVLFLGDGHYDYKGINTGELNAVPPYESNDGDQDSPFYSHCSEDYFAKLSDTAALEVSLGRMNAQTLSQAMVMVDKVIEYETSRETKGDWRARGIIAADDGFGAAGGCDPIASHISDIEGVLASSFPKDVQTKKMYLPMYKTETVVGGRSKPDATKDLLASWNNGGLVVNWTGHGNPHVWAHERLFENASAIPQLNNRARLPFLTGATCDFGHWDIPGEQSGNELLMYRSEGGIIGSISASRTVFGGGETEQLLDQYYKAFFARTSRGARRPVGEALTDTKNRNFGNLNWSKFYTAGDPSMRIGAPYGIVSADSVNGQSFDSVKTLRALEHVKFSGKVLEPDGTLWSNFSGTINATLYGVDTKNHISELCENTNLRTYDFNTYGSILFRGQAQVAGGIWQLEFVMPKDINPSVEPGRLFFYAQETSPRDVEASDASGATRNIVINGIDTTAVNDGHGPEITLFMGTRNFLSGDLVPDKTMLIVDLRDSSGINTSTSAIGHGIEAWFDDNSQSIDLTSYYKSFPNTYRAGEVTSPQQHFSDGLHSVRVRAWDVFDNSSTGQTSFRVASSADVVVDNPMNFPNPMRSGTTFTFTHNQTSPLDVKILIYTVAGRRVKTIERLGVSDQFVRIGWDGHDDDGDILANGEYFFQITATDPSNGKSGASRGTLSMLR